MSHEASIPGDLRDLAGAPFPVRLGLARHLVGCPTCAATFSGAFPLHVVDQLEAAASETAALLPLVCRAARFLDPGRGWRSRVEAPSPETAALVLAALLGCLGTVCPHLRGGGPQPAFARLPLRRVDCRRCAATVRRPPSEDAHTCDVCGMPQDVPWFVPFAIATGPTLVTGDACSACAAVLGVADRRRAS